MISRQKDEQFKKKKENKMLLEKNYSEEDDMIAISKFISSKKCIKTIMIQDEVTSSNLFSLFSDSSIKKRKRVIKNLIHLSTQSYKKYNTDHYTLYNLNNNNNNNNNKFIHSS